MSKTGIDKANTLDEICNMMGKHIFTEIGYDWEEVILEAELIDNGNLLIVGKYNPRSSENEELSIDMSSDLRPAFDVLYSKLCRLAPKKWEKIIAVLKHPGTSIRFWFRYA